MTTPAILGGTPAFGDGLPFARPLVPPFDAVAARVATSYERGMLTNGPLVAELEERCADRLGVRNVVAVSSCTNGLILVLQALTPKHSTVALPSFTFSASAHAVAWNGLQPLFAECDPETFQLDVEDVRDRLVALGEGGSRPGALLATHVFGAPCRPDAVEAIGRDLGIPVVFDAAHAFGAEHDGRRIGSGGNAEVFSMSPTKIVVAGEGGLVATDDDDLAQTLRIGRDYGNPGDYDTAFAGLNARLSELHAALALESLSTVEDHLAARRELAASYRDGISGIPGLRSQRIPASDASTFKDLTIAVDGDAYGLTRTQLIAALRAEGVDTRCYFDPPVHRQSSYSDVASNLPVTDAVSSQVVSLPMFGALDVGAVETILGLLAEFHDRAPEIARASDSTETAP